MLFVLRILKTLDFQPKVALITRTLRNTIVDLIHFLVLFTIVWMGYTIAGHQLFGHLFVDFSTIARGATGLMVLLVNWDPSHSIVQVLIVLIVLPSCVEPQVGFIVICLAGTACFF